MSHSTTQESDGKQFWDSRARQSFVWRGERYYTITPVPMYVRRRKIVLSRLSRLMAPPSVVDICDFGCGDGWYLRYFWEQYRSKHYYGCDLSASMIDLARQASPAARLVVSGRIDIPTRFHLVYVIAVFAHIKDDTQVRALFHNVNEHLSPGETFVLFEQTAPHRREGESWCRRTSRDYVSMAEAAGLHVKDQCLITFPIHRLFEKHIARHYYYGRIARGQTQEERRINANRSPFFRLLSLLAVLLSGTGIRADDGALEGNSLLVFQASGTRAHRIVSARQS
jgi:SAM-dependent methyltransferase